VAEEIKHKHIVAKIHASNDEQEETESSSSPAASVAQTEEADDEEVSNLKAKLQNANSLAAKLKE
jgi:hypothetical protein